MNPDRRESDLQPIPPDVLALWRGSSPAGAPQTAASAPDDTKFRTVSLWWYVMLLALVAALAQTAVASGYMGTQREEL